MKNMYGIVSFLVVITITASSLLFVAANEELFMVVDHQTTMDAGMTRANPVETGILILEDGKQLKLSRKSSPGKNCIDIGQPCGALDPCCDPYYCSGYFTGTCQSSYCVRSGGPCFSGPCCGVCTGTICVG